MSDGAFERRPATRGPRRSCAGARAIVLLDKHVSLGSSCRPQAVASTSMHPAGPTPTNDLETISRSMSHATQTN